MVMSDQSWQNCQMAKKSRVSGYRFKELREQTPVTLEQLSEKTDISTSQLSRFESGDREPRVGELLRIASQLRVPWQEFIESGTTGWGSVPLISWVSAGKLSRADVVEELETAPRVHVANLPAGDWLALKVEGTSMDRISPPDSVILVNRRDRRLVANACYVIEDDEEGATYKRFRPGPIRFEPVSTVEGHKTLFPEQEPKIIGRVRKTILDM